MQVFTAVVNRVIVFRVVPRSSGLLVYLQAPKKIAAWLLKRQLPSNPDDRGTTRKTITLEVVYLKNYIHREPINILEELNDQIYETLAAVIPSMLRLATENIIKRARLFLQMKGGHFEHLL
jgi:hypothetical protein